MTLNNITLNVNKVYSKKNPSTYFRNYKGFKKFIENKKKFLYELKLPLKIFKNSSLIDFGCGSGQNSIFYNILGCKSTLVEYDKQSCINTYNLFKRYSKNKFKIVNTDIFNFKSKKKFDFVVSNGVIHHTKDPKKNINICIKHLKKNGFIILGWGEIYGFFQRNIQRIILYSISRNNHEIIKYSKILFKDHLSRSVKFSGRKIDEIIYDTYINPRIKTVSLEEVLKIFAKKDVELYSSYQNIVDLINLNNLQNSQFKLIGNNLKDRKKILLNNFYNFSLSNQNIKKIDKSYRIFNNLLKKIVNKVNDKKFTNSKVTLPYSELKLLNKMLYSLKKEELIDFQHNKIFFKELDLIFRILNTKENKTIKFHKIKKTLKKVKKIFKGYNGVGMNYIVGYKL